MSFTATHPKEIGDRSQLAIILALRSAGYGVLLPLGENTRYDLAIEWEGELSRVQCKTGHLQKGAVYFRTASSYYHHPKPKMPARHYRGQIDFFGVYCVETGVVYLVPINALSVDHRAALRVDPPRNNQHVNVRWAADYEIGTVAIGGLRAPSGA
jgi:PD-(D/E)XK endonuclease